MIVALLKSRSKKSVVLTQLGSLEHALIFATKNCQHFDIIEHLDSFNSIFTLKLLLRYNPTNIHLFKVNNRNTRKRCEICSKLTIKTPKRRPIEAQCSTFPANIYLIKINNRNTRKRCVMCSMSTIKTPERRHWLFSSVSVVDFEQVNVSWELSG